MDEDRLGYMYCTDYVQKALFTESQVRFQKNNATDITAPCFNTPSVLSVNCWLFGRQPGSMPVMAQSVANG